MIITTFPGRSDNHTQRRLFYLKICHIVRNTEAKKRRAEKVSVMSGVLFVARALSSRPLIFMTGDDGGDVTRAVVFVVLFLLTAKKRVI